ncbi:hypothetical protein EV360DRAFT_10055, partial [Lentinula raphanica]
LGQMNILCPRCHAFHWKAERTSRSLFGSCCDSGKVDLPHLSTPPRAIQGLFTATDPEATEFRDNITQYNSALAFTSLGADRIDNTVNRYGPRNWVFRIQGNLRHLSSALEPPPGRSPSYAQLYTYDPTIALRQRMNRNPNVQESTMLSLQNALRLFNPYTKIYEHAFEVLRRCHDIPNPSVRLRVMPGNDPRRYNLPTSDEVGMILPGDAAPHDSRDILLRKRVESSDPVLIRVSDRHAAYAPLHYVLLFPYGESGWHEGL